MCDHGEDQRIHAEHFVPWQDMVVTFILIARKHLAFLPERAAMSLARSYLLPLAVSQSLVLPNKVSQWLRGRHVDMSSWFYTVYPAPLWGMYKDMVEQRRAQRIGWESICREVLHRHKTYMSSARPEKHGNQCHHRFYHERIGRFA